MTRPDGQPRRAIRTPTVVIGVTITCIIGIGLFFLLRSDNSSDTALGNRQAAVAERGAHVMPFDQTKTTHVFNKTADGGIETVTVTVTATASSDTSQIELIRMHLQHEAQLFASGDFSDPASIHGTNMPGLANLEHGADEITFTYADAPRGATITYRTTNAKLVDALHAWFDAQLADHGQYAHG